MSVKSVVVVPFEPGPSSAVLRRLGPLGVPERWHAVDRSAHAPYLVAVPGDDDEEWVAAALVTARPHTAYLKIVDAVGDVPAAVRAVVAHAREQGLAQVKWEGWTAGPEAAAAAGFTPLRPPLAQSEGVAGPAAGYVRWLHDEPVTDAENAGAPYPGTPYPDPPYPDPPYYGQSTHFSCGAVTALVAQAHAGTLSRDALDREAELTLWRDATNFPACEPVGLGVAVRRAWPSSPVTVHLDTDRPVLLGHYPENEQEWRALLQRTSRTEAGRVGVPVDPERLSLTAIRDAIGRREHVLLLVSLAAMQGFDVPHWVLCHGVVPGAVVIEDPWANAATGDTWVDAHLLPVPDRSLDTMSSMATGGTGGTGAGDAADAGDSAGSFRGAVVIGRP
ncbi:peptidase C39 family protein [Streptomyces sp. LRE541]|uniref:peptidase C39 family protein n=1 Tax=Streptomyces sp. LRE541 TaxID=2931983 RepID=UPI00200BB9C3|nr:peptidase C39 family protein [Streptomyces sp. LRE541]UPZ34467.1 peptidase C39 family protein [Streptomyces sp. LRE541]